MELDLAQGPIGQVGAYELDLKGGKLLAKVNFVGPGKVVGADVTVAIDGHAIFAKIKEAIPGDGIPENLLSIVEAALLGAPPVPQA